MKRTITRFSVGVLCALAMVLATGTTHALTKADVQIRNQATATYIDADGRVKEATSNEVITTVLPIYALEVLPNKTGGTQAPGNFTGTAAMSQTAAPGNTVYFQYTLQNQGNKADTFKVRYINDGAGDSGDPTNIRIYQDLGPAGVDPGDILLHNGTAFGGTSTNPVQPDGYISIIVSYTIPVGAAISDTFRVDLDARSDGLNTVTDAISNFNITTVSNKGNLTALKSVNVASAKIGDVLTYTINGSNTGNAPVYGSDYLTTMIDLDASGTTEQRSGVLVTDDLPVQLYNGAAPTITNITKAPASSTVLYWTGTIWTSDAGDISTTDPRIALFIPDATPTDAVRDVTLAVGQAYQLKFDIVITDNESGTQNFIFNEAVANWDDDTNPPSRSTTSSKTVTEIGGAGSELPAVVLGPNGDPADVGTTTNDDGQDESGDKGTTPGLVGDVADAGETIIFTNTLRNDGNIDDIMNITIPANGVTSGGKTATILLLKLDGVTPLPDSNGDSLPDSGTLAPGESFSFKVKVIIPADFPTSAGPHNIRLTATTVQKNPTSGLSATNDTWNVIGAIRPAGVDIAKDGETGDADNTDTDDKPAGVTRDPGTIADFALDVENVRKGLATVALRTTGAVDTYNLTLAQTDVIGAVDTKLYRDLNGNGVLDAAELIPITNTEDLDPDDIESIIARVTLPPNAAPGLRTIVVTATSTNNSAITDSIQLDVTVNLVAGVKIQPDNEGVIVRGGSLIYRHVVTNTGNSTEDFNLTAVSLLGWTYSFVTSDGTNLGTAGVSIADYGNATLSPGESQEIFVKIFAPEGAAVGAKDVLTVTATGATNATATDSATDVTTVIDGNLQLVKSVDKATARPTRTTATVLADFDPVTYTVTYTNLAKTDLTTVKVIDSIPPNTRLVVATDGADGTTAPSNTAVLEYSTDGGLTWAAWGPAASADHSNANVTTLRWTVGTAGTLASGATGSVTFQVLID